MSSENKDKTLAVVNCSQLVTLAGPARPRVGPELRELGLFPNGGMFVRDGMIESVGSRDEIELLIDSETEVVDALGKVVLPGFVDAHTHPVFAGTRVPVQALLDYLEGSQSLQEFLDDFPTVERDQAITVLEQLKDILLTPPV